MILVLGPTGSGKTTLVKVLLSVQRHHKSKTEIIEIDELPSVQPTVGTNISNLIYSRKSIEIREVGGCMIPIWKSYYKDAGAIVFVIDSSNFQQISLTHIILQQIISSQDTKAIPFLILFNKIDIPTRTGLNEIKYLLHLNQIAKKACQPLVILDISCKEMTGILDVFKWVCAQQL